MFIELSCSPASYRVLGAVPLGEGVADKPTKRRESVLIAGGDSWSDLAWERGEGFPLLLIKNRRYNNANR